jgi:hypothetical protein
MSGYEISSYRKSLGELERKLLDHYDDALRTPGQRHEISRRVGELLPPAAALPLRHPSLASYTLEEVKQKYLLEFEKILEEVTWGIWYVDDRRDYYEIEDEQTRLNALSVTLVCMKDGLVDKGSGFHELRVTAYSEKYSLSREEKFYSQPVISGPCCSGVLVAEDVVLLASHFLNFRHVKELRFVFGFVMIDPVTALTTIPDENIYSGIEIIQERCDICGPSPSGSDWGLVRLDRPVQGQEIATLSTTPVYYEQPLYSLGFPCTLPLKQAAGVISGVQKAYFKAEMSGFDGSSGSPVFDCETHQLVGIITRGDGQDFKGTRRGNISMVYPNDEVESEGVLCTKVSEFREFLEREEEPGGWL